MSSQAELDAELAEALHGLDAIDDLVDVALAQPHDDSKLAQYLNSGADLGLMLASQDKELRILQEQFIEEHCQQAESLCTLHVELTECETKLSAFEEQIFTFQKSLTDTAEDIVRMQQQTVELVHRVANRKHVSNRISEVYNALKECEEFCEAINHRDVDSVYLGQIRELESKIAFLATNKELENSPVDLEIRPKLRVAAQRAGEKLQRYLTKKMVSLSEDGTNIALQQQALEKVGQYAYSFLARYNTPVAAELRATYVRIMSDVYFRQTRDILREFGDFLPHGCGSAGPMIGTDVVNAIRTNKDCGAVGGTSFAPPPCIGPASGARDMKRAASVSVRMEDRIAGFIRSKSEARGASVSAGPRRETDLHDLVDAMRCADFSYSVVTLDPASVIDLDRTTCWVWRFVKVLSAVLNMVLGESKFVSKFFFAHGQDLESEELLGRTVLSKSLDLVMGDFHNTLPQIRDRLSSAAGLRVIERAKTFLCQNANPIPLLLLSELFEVSTNSLRRVLHQIVEADTNLMSQLASLAFAPFSAPNSNQSAADMAVSVLLKTTPKLASALGPHDVTRQFALTTGALHLFNTMPMPYSRVDGVSVRADEILNQHLRSQLTSFMTLVDHLASRHQTQSLRSVFRIHNLAHVLLLWRSMASRFSLDGNGRGGASPTSPLEAEACIGSGPHVAPSAHINDVEAQLRNEIVRYIAAEGRYFGVHDMMLVVQEAEAALGSAFFASKGISTDDSGGAPSPSGPSASLPDVSTLPAMLQETALLATITQFSRSWKDDLRSIAESSRTVFGLPPDAQRARSVTPDTAGIEEATTSEFLREVGSLVLKEYFHSILDANARVHTLVNTFYSQHSGLQAKLVGNLALLHEVQGLLQ